MSYRFHHLLLLVVCLALAPIALANSSEGAPGRHQGSHALTQVLDTVAAEPPITALASDPAPGNTGLLESAASATPVQVSLVALEIRVYSPIGEPLTGVVAYVSYTEPSPTQLAQTGADRTRQVLSDAEGLLILGQLPPDTPLHLMLMGDGLVPEAMFDIVPAIDSPVQVVLRPTATLRGRIFDEEGEAIPEAEVRIAGHGGRRTPPPRVLSDAEGRFDLQGLEPGPVDLEISAPTFRPFRLTALDPVSGEGDVLITLRRGKRISGTVLDPRGFPLADATIKLIEPEAGLAGEERAARTNVDGYFELVGLSPGPRALRATHADHPPTALEVELEDDTEVELQFEKGLAITGRVLDRLGPVTGVPVRVHRFDGPHRRTVAATTDPEGRFSLGSLAPGTYRVRAEPRDRAPRSQTIELGPSLNAELELRLAPGATVTGVVRGLASVAAGLRVTATGAGPVRSVEVRPDGWYRLEHLPAGQWTLRLNVGGRLALESIFIESWAAEQGAEVPLDLGAGRTLSGQIRCGGEPFRGAWVSLTAGSFWARVPIARDGTFRFEGLADGPYELGVHDFASGLRHRQPLVVEGDGYVSLDLIPTALRATVRDAATGVPLPGVLVRLARLTATGE